MKSLVDTWRRSSYLSSLQIMCNLQRTWLHKSSKGEELSKGLPSFHTVSHFQWDRRELNLWWKEIQIAKMLVLITEAFPWIDAIQQTCSWIHSTGLPHLPFSRLQSYLHALNKGSQQNHRIQTQGESAAIYKLADSYFSKATYIILFGAECKHLPLSHWFFSLFLLILQG